MNYNSLFICVLKYLNKLEYLTFRYRYTKNSYLLTLYFPGTVYFSLGRKNPKIIMNNYEFKMRPTANSSKTLWICTQESRKKCKVRLLSYGRCIKVKAVQHNHQPTYTGNYELLKSQVVNIEYTTDRFSL